MKLVIVHYHLRPGGIRRVIEVAAPHLVRHRKIESVTLACGEADDRQWNRHLTELLHPVPVEFFVEPSFGYFSEQRKSSASIARQIKAALQRLSDQTAGDEVLLWAHNLGVGRNLLLARELARFAKARNWRMLSHHHDWWFDQRWLRRIEIQRAGFRTLDSVARAIFPPLTNAQHAAINCEDAAILKHRLPNSSGWLPNPVEHGHPPAPREVSKARRWLQHGHDGAPAPIWLLPCRFLRRKDIAEALLLTRWLRPEAWLVTTGGPSSADEVPYYQRLATAAKKHRWPARFGILQGDESRKPAVASLMAASECVLLTSLQEGFGLPYIEAAAAQLPLVARSLPNIAPDLNRFGFRFPQSYDEIWVHPDLFDWPGENARQAKLFAAWKRQLPRACHQWAGPPALLNHAKAQPVPFSRLTLTAQIEVLAQTIDRSWQLCAPLNPFLKTWRERAARGVLRPTAWPRTADRWLGGAAYARRFYKMAGGGKFGPLRLDPTRLQTEFIREKLGAGHQFPLLWSRDS